MITQYGRQDRAGVVGMNSGNHSSVDQNNMFMTNFKADSDITENVFSFYMTGTQGQSYIDFGTPNTAVMDGSPIYISIKSENEWWTSDLTGFRWGSTMSD